MKVYQFENGPFSVNSFIVTGETHYVVIDPGEDILHADFPEGLLPAAALITHPHIDHVEGINPLKRKFPDLPIMISEEGAPLLSHMQNQAAFFGLSDPGIISYDALIIPDREFTIGGITVTPIPTPGHCPGSLSFLIGNNLFTGDTLFRGTIGRTDIPGGNAQELLESIKTRLMTLPDDTVVYPGHSQSTTIGREKKANLWVRER